MKASNEDEAVKLAEELWRLGVGVFTSDVVTSHRQATPLYTDTPPVYILRTGTVSGKLISVTAAM